MALSYSYIYFTCSIFSRYDTLLIVLAVGVKILYSFFWGILEGKNLVGFSAFIRGVVFSFLYLAMGLSVYLGYHTKLFTTIVLFLFVLLFVVFSFMVSNQNIKILQGKVSFSFKEIFQVSKENLLFNLVVSVMYVLERTFLNKIKGPNQLAIYSSQYEFSTRGNLISSTVSSTLYPTLIKNSSFKIWKNITECFLFLLALITFVMAIFSYEIVDLYLGDKYRDFHYLLNYLVIGLYMNTFGYFTIPYMRALNNFKTYTFMYLISMSLALLLAYPLINNYGIVGAVMVYLVIRLGDFFCYLHVLTFRRVKEILWAILPVFILTIQVYQIEIPFLVIVISLYIIVSVFYLRPKFNDFKSFILRK